MVDETDPTLPDEPVDPTDPPPEDPPADDPPADDPPPIIAYLVTYSRPGHYVRYAVVQAYDLDGAWGYAWANCAGTDWTPTRIIVQPTWIGNDAHPEAPGSVAADA